MVVAGEEEVDDGDGPSETAERTRADVMKKRRIEKEEEEGASLSRPCCPWLPASAGVAAGRGGGRGVKRDRVRVLDDVIRVPVPRLPETRRTFAHIRLGGVGADESASGAQSRRSHGFHLHHLHATLRRRDAFPGMAYVAVESDEVFTSSFTRSYN